MNACKVLLVAALLLASCAPIRPPTTAPGPGTPSTQPGPATPESTAPAAAPQPAAPTASSGAPAQAATAEPARPSITTVPPDRIAPLFGPAWGDREVYRRGLVTGEHGILDGLPGASEYRIDLTIGESFTAIAGRQQVYYTNREAVPLDRIFLRLFPNALGGEMVVSAVQAGGIEVSPAYRFERTALEVLLPQPLDPGQSTILALDYRITAPTTLDKGYGLISYTRDILALDTPYAPIPVFDDEGWNVETPPANADTSYNDASFYLVRITAPAALELVATGVAVEQERGSAAQTVTFALGPARDFFIAGSARYVSRTAQLGETQVSSYALEGEEEAAGVALDAAVNALRIFEQRFGAYPYTEFDVAATPMLALGIEYPGTVGISEKVYDPCEYPDRRRQVQVLESTVAHEVAHQWFYNLAGNDQVDEPWLDEAASEYLMCTYFLDRYGQEAAQGCRQSWEARWDRVDRLPKSVGLPSGDYEASEYSPIVYGRGALFLAALADRMGQQVFDQFLAGYVAHFRWEIATAADFRSMAEVACGCDLDDLYREWLDPVAVD